MKEAAAGIEEEAITSAKEAASSKSEAVAGGALAELAKERTDDQDVMEFIKLGSQKKEGGFGLKSGTGPSGGDSLILFVLGPAPFLVWVLFSALPTRNSGRGSCMLALCWVALCLFCLVSLTCLHSS